MVSCGAVGASGKGCGMLTACACASQGVASLLVPVLVLSGFALLSAYNVHLALYRARADDNHLAPVCRKIPLRQLSLCITVQSAQAALQPA